MVPQLPSFQSSFCALSLQDPEKPLRLRGSFLTLTERLDEEFVKILQNTDAHSTDYVERWVALHCIKRGHDCKQ